MTELIKYIILVTYSTLLASGPHRKRPKKLKELTMTNHKTRKNLITFTFLFALGVGLSAVWPNFYQPEASAASTVIEDSANVYRAVNITRGETALDYRSEVEASPGEAIQLLVMVHLGAEGTSAGNVSVKVDLSDLITKAFITSSENNVEDTVKIIVPSDQELVFIPEHGVILTTPAPGNLPSNVPTETYTWPNSDDLFGSGVDLGNISSISTVYISFKVYVSNKTANMSITKEVASVTNPDGSWHKSIDVERGERVRFQIVVKNTGDSELNDVLITDSLPDELEYIPGSSEYSTPYSGGFQSLADSWITGDGGVSHANLGKLPVGDGYNAIIIFDALIKNDAAEGEHKNTAQAKTNEYPDWIYDRATVNVEVPAGTCQLSVDKKVVWNGNEYDHIDKETHLFDPEEKVYYKIYVENSGDANANGVKVVDHLPAYIRTLGGNDTQEFDIGTIKAGETWKGEYTAKVLSDLPQNDRTQENRATVDSDETCSDEDTAFIWINGPEILAAPPVAAEAPPELPVAGPAVPVIFGLLSMLPVGVLLRRSRIVSYLSN